MIFLEKPKNFNESVKVCAIYAFYENKLLLLKRSKNKQMQPGKWGVVAGKINPEEEMKNTALREFFEETGINLEIQKLKFIKEVYIKWEGFEFVFNIFKYKFDKLINNIKLNSENEDYKWVDLDSIKEYDLIKDELECLELIN